MLQKNVYKKLEEAVGPENISEDPPWVYRPPIASTTWTVSGSPNQIREEV